jgi:hypothetical protein
MRRALWMLWAGSMLALGGGCASWPVLNNPSISPDGLPFGPAETAVENPVYVPLGPVSYGKVFENVLSALFDTGFEIFESNRYAGQIETFPRVSPGLIMFFKAGSPDP